MDSNSAVKSERQINLRRTARRHRRPPSRTPALPPASQTRANPAALPPASLPRAGPAALPHAGPPLVRRTRPPKAHRRPCVRVRPAPETHLVAVRLAAGVRGAPSHGPPRAAFELGRRGAMAGVPPPLLRYGERPSSRLLSARPPRK